MSRIGKKPVPVIKGVSASVSGNVLKVSGPKGSLEQSMDPLVEARVDGDAIIFERKEETRNARALHGLYRSLAANMCQGVTEGFSKSLEVVGTGYGVKVEGKSLVLAVGFCHPLKVEIPSDLEVTCPGATQVLVSGIDKQAVGDFAARVRKLRPPEPYKGKGIRYLNEIVRRKAGKTLAGK